MKKRQSNFELLRLIAMAMVVTLHYMDKGISISLTNPMDMTMRAAYVLEACAIVAVNTYVLLTGYFMCTSRFRLGRLLQTVLQVLFYSLLVSVILCAVGLADWSVLTTYDKLYLLFPLSMKHYWFMTSYVVLVLLSPILNRAIATMTKEQLLAATLCVTLPQIVLYSILPIAFEANDKGYSAMWFVALYLIAAYIRLYGIPWFCNVKRALFAYLGSVAVIWGGCMAINLVYVKSGRLGERLGFALSYNFVFVLVASVAFFYMFYHMKDWQGAAGKVILRLSPYALGVYLLHENILLRYQWPVWLGVSTPHTITALLIGWIGAVLIVMAIGLFVDYVRGCLFMLGSLVIAHTPLPGWIGRIEELVNGEKKA